MPEGPLKYNGKGGLLIDGKATVLSPASRFGAHQSDTLRAVDDLKGSLTGEDTAVDAPVNFPSWGHIVRLCGLFRFRAHTRPLEIRLKLITRKLTNGFP